MGDAFLSTVFSADWRALGNGQWPCKALSKVPPDSKFVTLGSANPVLDHYRLIEHVTFRFFHATRPTRVKVGYELTPLR